MFYLVQYFAARRILRKELQKMCKGLLKTPCARRLQQVSCWVYHGPYVYWPSSYYPTNSQLAEIWRSEVFDLQCLLPGSSKVKGQGHVQLPAYGFLIVPIVTMGLSLTVWPQYTLRHMNTHTYTQIYDSNSSQLLHKRSPKHAALTFPYIDNRIQLHGVWFTAWFTQRYLSMLEANKETSIQALRRALKYASC